MSILCFECDSDNTIKKGLVERFGNICQRYKCKDCGSSFYIEDSTYIKKDDMAAEHEHDDFLDILEKSTYIRDEDWINEKLNAGRYVITSAQSNTDIDDKFFDSLEAYCKENGANLLIVPVKYRNPTTLTDIDVVEHVYDPRIEKYLFENNIRLHPKLKVLGSLKIAATAQNPLTGLASISKGDSVVIGHNQLQQMTLPVQPDDKPVIMTTTGSISKKNYSISKQGYKAEFNHSNSAVVVEMDDDFFHIRHLNFDGVGFYDFENYYAGNVVEYIDDGVKALVTGDEHITFFSPDVYAATYDKGGIVDTLKPSILVRHDVLDSYSISHHHKKNFLVKYKKYIEGEDDITEELLKTIEFICETTPDFATNVIVASNHNDHLTKWLNECDPKQDKTNAKMYHYLMLESLNAIENGDCDITPFQLFAEPILKENDCNTKFLGRRESLKICGVEIAVHGDIGSNGTRGTRDTFSKLPSKTIVGHSHSPGIEKGCYQVGTSSILNLEYNNGPSSWMNTHCLIYKNGKRQLINIVDGKWRS